MNINLLFSGLALLLTFYAFLPYIRSILNGTSKPHVFSWIIWGSTTMVVFFAQLADKAGLGAWPIGVSGLISITVAILAYLKKSNNSISRIDWSFFIVAMSSLPLWYLTSDPVWAVLILTAVDVIGFAPTIGKSYRRPNDEPLLFYLIFMVRNSFVIIALENYSLTTVLFPAVTGLACLLLIGLIVYRRRVINL